MESKNELKDIYIKNHTCYHLDDTIKIEDFDHDYILIGEKSHENILISNISHKSLIDSIIYYII